MTVMPTDTRTQRRLAAILAADVVAFSRMMGADEAGTLAALRDMWATQFNPAVATHHGRIVKMMGDGALVEFGSAVDAVECALAVQGALTGPVRLRIGVNLGDIVIEGDDIFGDGVNVAARLEPQAPPGGILVSDAVHAQVRGRIAAPFVDGGDMALKNIASPVRVWSWGGTPRAPLAPAPDRPGIAVLPFNNMSDDPDQEYFSDGISEDIITDLSKVSGLMVVARNSSFAYKGKSPDIRQVGRDLGVTSVLEGSIRRAGNRARITAQLIDATTGGHLWAERYDRDLTDIFAVQDELTMKIVDVLKVKLLPAERDGITRDPTPNLAAHDAYLRGRELHATLFTGPPDPGPILRQTMAEYDRALALDPGYAQAWAGKSLAWTMEFQNEWLGLPEAQAASMTCATCAVDNGPDDAYAHLSMAIANLIAGDVAGLKAEAERALALNPNFAGAYSAIGNSEIFLGNPRAAIPYFEIAIRLDATLAPQTRHFMGLALLLAGDYAAAAGQFRERIAEVPRTDISRVFLAACLGHLGQGDAARAVWRELMQIKPGYDLEAHLGRLPWHSPSDPARIRDGLALSGLPPPDAADENPDPPADFPPPAA